MPYIEGGTFEKWLFDTNTPKEKDKTKKTLSEVRNILQQILHSISYIHRNGIIHKDIKLQNILIDNENIRPILADFGIRFRIHFNISFKFFY